MPKVLIITYYWPPAGGSGVQRWLKFTKYLRDFGWEPVIFTALNPEAPAYDEDLINEVPEGVEVIRKQVWEPYSLFRILTGRKDQKFGAGLASAQKPKHNLVSNFFVWIRGNVFIPDARMFWIRPSASFLIKYLRKNPVDIIVSTGPPHSTHLIAKRVSKSLNIPWVADFRDPWTDIDFFHELKPGRISTSIHKRMEKSVLQVANRVVAVTPSGGKDFIALGAKKLEVIENGYDEADFPSTFVKPDDFLSITHIGTLPYNRNCRPLWKAISNLCNKNAEFARKLKIQFAGSVDTSVIDSLKENNLFGYCNFLGYLSHAQSIDLQRKSQVLLLIVNSSPNAKGILTGKVFEYLAAKRPIIAVGPLEGDVHNLIEQTNSGFFASFENVSEIERAIEKMWNSYVNQWGNFNPKGIERYSRRELTRQMANLFDNVINERTNNIS